jgi:hypothetical protein
MTRSGHDVVALPTSVDEIVGRLRMIEFGFVSANFGRI